VPEDPPDREIMAGRWYALAAEAGDRFLWTTLSH
jgi:hypothetical protein